MRAILAASIQTSVKQGNIGDDCGHIQYLPEFQQFPGLTERSSVVINKCVCNQQELGKTWEDIQNENEVEENELKTDGSADEE